MKSTIISCIATVILLSACSSKEVYQFGRNVQKSDCIKHAATEEDHRACEAMETMSYEEYEKERQKLKTKG
ncbi:hypothetical protein [Thalassotalea fusca]